MTSALRRLALALLLTLLPHAALAKGPPRVMVLEVPADEAFKASALKTLNAYLASAVREQGFAVVTPADIGAALGVERQRQLLGCSENSCLAEIGGALGVDFILQPTLAMLETQSVVTLSLVNAKGESVGSQRKVVQGRNVEGFLPVIDELVPKLMVAAKPAQLAPAVSTTPAGGLTASAAPPSTSPSHVPAYAVGGAGAVLALASIPFGVLAESDHGKYIDALEQGDVTTAHTQQRGAKTQAGISTALLAVGVVGLVTGGVLWLTE